jgi:hypothetical protein
MRRFALTASIGTTLLNCFLAYSGQYFSSQVRQFLEDQQTKPSYFSLIALAIPPWFYLVAAAMAVVAILRLTRKVDDNGLIYMVIPFKLKVGC